jgi:hypothetical protein
VAAPAQFVREIVPSAPGGAPVRRASLQFVRRGWRAVARRSRGTSRLPKVQPSHQATQQTPEPTMNKTFAAQAAPIALAALLSAAMLLATNALAGHQYRVAVAAHETAQLFASADVQRVVVVARRANG